MTLLWLRYIAWFARLQARERLIVAVAVIGGELFLGVNLAIAPAWERAQKAALALATLPTQTLAVQAQTQSLLSSLHDPDASLKADLARVDAELARQSERFSQVEQRLVSPAQAIALLEKFLRSARGLQLLSLRSLPPAPLLSETAAAPGTASPAQGSGAGMSNAHPVAQMYKHGVELKVAGGYLDLLTYLKTLETNAPGLIWGRLDLSVEQYPRSVMTLTVYSLSMDVSWIAL